MSNTKIIKALVEQFSVYEEQAKHPSVEGFAGWLLKKEWGAKDVAVHLSMGKADAEANERVTETDSAIGILLGILNKYARNYSKVAMENMPLNSVEEFGYLAQLSSHNQLTKTELIHKTMDGKTTGMDIIRRLVEYGLAKEKDNPEDKRSKLLLITEKGKRVVAQAYQRMGNVSRVVVGNLTQAEKLQLLASLDKLASHHKQQEQEITTALRSL